MAEARKIGAAVPRARRVETEFLEGIRRRCPSHPMVLKALGDLYTRSGRIEDGLMVDLDLTRLCPGESEVWYNLGCSYALAGRKDEALAALQHAVELGYQDVDWMRRDSHLESLRTDPRFNKIIRQVAAN
jgi:hypothetical protein